MAIFDVSDLEKEYDLLVLRVAELRSDEMRKLICGDYRAKLAALWQGPFEFYVWLDSDAIVWGDFTSHVRTDVDFQIFWSEISVASDVVETPSWLSHFYFDPEKLQRFDHPQPGVERTHSLMVIGASGQIRSRRSQPQCLL